MSTRTRFAPSPTGYLHIGGARTALYCWLFAKQQQGHFILRIEDTDKERSTEASVNAILKSMRWLGLDYQEGPFYQTERMERYQEVIQQLLKEGKAYRCHCSKERIEALREAQLENKEKPRYDSHCRTKNVSADEPHVIRFANPLEGEVIVDDWIHGSVVFQNTELDDLIIARTDGTPTYNFTVVVDDWDMRVTHVMRGDDHLNNTPRQINMLKALNAHIPHYAHMPMILGPDGKRLSKRSNAVSVMEYRDEGYLPEALLNYLARLGWSHGDQEIFTRDEMIELFDIRNIHKSPAALNPDKLLWLNQQYLKSLAPEVIAERLQWYFNQQGIPAQHGPALQDIVVALRERTKTLVEMAEWSHCYYQDNISYDEKAVAKHLKPVVKPTLELLLQRLSTLTSWDESSLHDAVATVADELALKLGKVAQPLRVAVTGITTSPGITATLMLVGQSRTIKRIKHAISLIS